MSLWSSFRRFSRAKKNEHAEATRCDSRGRSKSRRSLRHRDLRMEQFEQRMLLSITTSTLNDYSFDDLPLFGDAAVTMPEVGSIQLIAAADSPDEFRPLKPMNVNAADTTNAEYLQPGGSLGLNLDGFGYTVGVWDGGTVLATHQEFGSRVSVLDPPSTDDHATHVAGTIGAAGVDPAAEGMATAVDIQSFDWDDDFIEMRANSGIIDVTNHSYGYSSGWDWSSDPSSPTGWRDIWWGDMSVSNTEDTKFGSYLAVTAELDDVLYDNPKLLSVWSAGNDRGEDYWNYSGDGIYAAFFSVNPGLPGWLRPGFYLVNSATIPPPSADGNAGTGYDSVGAIQTAKNNLTVGAVNDVIVDPYSSSDIQMSTFSGWGPTDDGRVKPDVVGNGVQVYSSVDTSNTAYDTKNGTSMASPNVAGTAVLLKQHIENSIPSFSPLSATLKGLIIHTAADAGNVGPDYSYGWGLVDAKKAAEFVTEVAAASGVAQITQSTYSGTEQTFTVTSHGNSPLTATLVWTDPAGTAQTGLDNSTPTLVNDLDLWITDAGGATYYPWTLDPASPNAPAVRTQLNHVDNVEQVKIDLTDPGVYTIHVGATGGVASQAFSLLVTNEERMVGPELVKIIPNAGGELEDGDTLHVAPRELLFQFNERQVLDTSTFDAIQITRAGGDPIEYQVLPGDKANRVIMRFAETLPDDSYTITIKGTGANPLKNVPQKVGDPAAVFNNGADQNIDFELDLGAQVVSVVPQPVYRDGFTLTATDLTAAADGKTFTVSDGFQSVTFEFNINSDPGGFDPNHVEISFTAGTPAATAAANMQAAVQAEFDVDLLTVSQADAVLTIRGSQASVDAGTTGFALVSIRTLNQAANKIDVYFNEDDLDTSAATNPTFYRLHRLNTTTGASEAILIPDKVVYSAQEDKAQLIFSSSLSAGTYHLEIGTSTEFNDSLSRAINVGTLWNAATTGAHFEGFIGDTPAGMGDVDTYRFSAGRNGILTVTLSSGTYQILDDAGLLNPTGTSVTAGQTYYVQIANPAGGTYSLDLSIGSGPTIIGNSSSFATATALGILGAAQQAITGENITLGGAALMTQIGGNDEPGHRHILPEAHFTATSNILGTGVIEYQFPETFSGSGGTSLNQITEPQKQRAREIFEIYSEYLGVEFRETANSGLVVATGDLRTLGDYPVGPGGVLGLGSSSIALMDASELWDDRFGVTAAPGMQSWFGTAIHEIGHSLGLSHAYDLPEYTTMGTSFNNPMNQEETYPGDYDLLHGEFLRPNAWNEIDLYQFSLEEPGQFTAETIAERRANPSDLDTQLVLYREVTVDATTKVRELIAQNDDYFSNDSMIQVELEPGTYYIGVMSTGMQDLDPTVLNSGFGGSSTGFYDLKLDFQTRTISSLKDATGSSLDGDADGIAGGTFDFWFQVGTHTLFVDKENAGLDSSIPGTTSLYTEIDQALTAAATIAQNPSNTTIVRVVGNAADTPYLVGLSNIGTVLPDGALVQLPADVTMMIDAGAVFKLQDANLEIGTSAQGISRAHAALQVLGTPFDQVHFRSFRDDSIGGDSDGSSSGKSGGDWGGLVFRADSDYEDIGVFANSVTWADIQHGGGKVMVDSVEDNYTSIHMLSARPTIAYSTVQYGAGGAISADLASFEDTHEMNTATGVQIERSGPDIHGNTVLHNSVNGLSVRIPSDFGQPQEVLEVAARWDDTDIIHVVETNLLIRGTPGGPVNNVAREDARLRIDPAVIVKLWDARIHTEIAGQLIAEGLPGYPIVFTSLNDDTYGMGGGFDTGNDQATQPNRGDWGGLVFAHTSNGSLDYIQLSYGGGQIPFNGVYDYFNPIEIHQADVRITNSVIELNAGGSAGGSNRNGLGTNAAAAIFVRGAQPVIVGNKIVDNQGDAVSINANALTADVNPDWGRSTGLIDAFDQFGDNYGPLVRLNTVDNTVAGGGTQYNGMNVRAGTSYVVLTTESVWDDTDIVHILRDEIRVLNQHSLGGLRLQSRPTESLVVKLTSSNAGFTADGTPIDVEDRIGGTIQVIGTPNYPVILTSINDNTAAAGFDLNGKPQGRTGGNGNPVAGNWNGITIAEYANARNVAFHNEIEPSYTGGTGINHLIATAQYLGELAPDQATNDEDDEKGGDDNLRLGFEVQGHISLDDPADVDVYSFKGIAGSEVWIDVDRTSQALEAKIELIDANGVALVVATGASLLNPGGLASVGSLNQNAWDGHDFYSTNPRDPGFYVVLPGTTGTKANYFLRVSSVDGADADIQGDTSGRYQMQVRLRQTDEKPGSTVRYADIRYATRGIEILGHPSHSILAAETAEHEDNVNDTRDDAQYLGNLLESDLTAIGLAGRMATRDDIDWYRLDIDQEYIQSIGGVNGGGKTWSTVFDIDYADGLGRADTVLAVYQFNPRGPGAADDTLDLVYLGQESNITEDQPGTEPGAGLDSDDLSRGSFGDLDPFIGPVHLPTITQSYYVAVSSNYELPAELQQYFTANPPNSNVRLEPINSIQRIVEDHIGFSGYETGDDNSHSAVVPNKANGILPLPSTANLAGSVQLSSYVVPYTLSDVALFVSTGNRLHIINPFTGADIVNVGLQTPDNGTTLVTMDDIAMRPDGTLMGERDGGNGGTSGNLYTINTGNAALTGGTDDGIPTFNNSPQDFGAFAFRDMGTNSWENYAVNNLPYDIVNEPDPGDINDANPALWRLSASGVAQDEDTSTGSTGLQPVAYLPTAPIEGYTMGTITGMQFVERSTGADDLYLVDSSGNLWRTQVVGSGNSSRSISGGWDHIANLGPLAFTGLTLAPRNLDIIDSLDADNDGFPDEAPDGIPALTNVLIASTANGLHAFTLNGIPVVVFDSNGDGSRDSSSVTVTSTDAININGLAFSPLDFNLWHPTANRQDDPGHGVAQSQDHSRDRNQSHSIAGVSSNRQQSGGASYYFGLEEYNAANSNGNYIEYYGERQFGILSVGETNGDENEYHDDLTFSNAIGGTLDDPDVLPNGNYNLPGGAYGSLITDTFDLTGCVSADKPTLYFTYFLDTENAQSNNDNTMRDSARAWIWGTLGGTTGWHLLATNNSRDNDDELPRFLSTSWDDSSDARQRIQELFDADEWRQARVDLGQFAGQAGLKLRFDFSTAGRLPGEPNLNSTVEGHGNFGSPERGQNNDHEGFYVDDIIVGFAERGEMVTNSNDNQDHFIVPQNEIGTDPNEILVGEYQLEIRRGTEYANNTTPMSDSIRIPNSFVFDTNHSFVAESGAVYRTVGTAYVGQERGDQNVERQQDQVIVESNTVRNSSEYGIYVAGGVRDPNPHAGSVINTRVLNTEALVPGVVVENNVVADFGTAGIFFAGDTSDVDEARAPVPFGRILNNTVVGSHTGGQNGVGIDVGVNASPTILNNIIVNTVTGLRIGSGSASTVIGSNLFQNNGSPGPTGSDPITYATPLFIGADVYNFYLASGSAAIDSAGPGLGERTAFFSVKNAMGIPPSPIITADRDRYNQLRRDDPNPLSPGTGPDRGAIERADFDGPTARIVDPYDNTNPRDALNPKLDGAYDYDSTLHDVVVINQKTTDFAVQLFDSGGIGIDDFTVTELDGVTVRTDVVKVYRVLDPAVFSTTPEADWPTLRLGADYLLDWDPTNNILHVFPATGIWAPGYYYAIDVNNAVVRDLAGNALQPNRSAAPFAGKTLFTIHLTGLDFGDLPDPSYVTLLESGPVDGQGGARHVVTGDAYLGSAPNVELNALSNADATGDYYDDGVAVTAALQMQDALIADSGVGTLEINASTGGYLNAWIDFNGDGKFDQAEERIAEDVWLDAGVNTLTVAVPADTFVNPADPAAADVYQRGARFRFTSFEFAGVSWLGPVTTDPAIGSEGIAADGEVEDYLFDVVRYRSDWGDAPVDIFTGQYLYPTRAARDGAVHYIHGPFLGTQIDAEMDGQPTLGAGGDDMAGVDDEDGVQFVGLRLIPGNDASQVLVTLDLNGAADAVLEGWIDFNGDGVWSDDYATTGVIDPSGQHDEFILTARDPGQVGTRIGVVFHTAAALNVSYDTPARVLTIEYVPGNTTVEELVNAIKASASPVTADIVAAADNDGTGTIPDGGLNLAVTRLASGGSIAPAPGTKAATGAINPPGANNTFEIVARANGTAMNGKRVTFYEVDNPGDPISVNWNGVDTLLVRYEPGVHTAQAIVNAIDALGVSVPLTAQLRAFEPSDGSGVIPIADLPDATTLTTAGAVLGTDIATIGVVNLTGDNNDFEIVAATAGTDGNDIDIVFNHDDGSATVTAAWDGAAGLNGTLTVTFDPDDTTAADLVDAVNNSGAPLTALLVDDVASDGSGTIADGDLADGPAYVTAGADWAVPATTGPINPPGVNNALEIYARDNDPARNGYIVAFYQLTSGNASVTWNGIDTLTVNFVPGATTVLDIVARINNLGAPLQAKADATVPDPNSGGGVLGEDGVIFDGAEFLLDGAYERIFTNQVLVDGPNTYDFLVPADARPGATYARFRVSETGLNADGDLLSFTGLAESGEVEDYAVVVQRMDYGDAPDSYGTLLERDIYGTVTSDGARHVIAGPWLGEAVDHNPVGLPGPDADGDDLDGLLDPNSGELIDDEDGVQFTQVIPGEWVSVDVTMGRNDFDGRAWFAVDPTAGPNDAFIVRSRDYGDALNGAEVTFLQVDGLPNDQSGTIAAADVADGAEYVTAFGSPTARATIGKIDPAGPNNAFEIRSKTTGGNGITVRFVHGTGVLAEWQGSPDNILTVTYEPGVTPLSQLISAVNGVAGSPLVAEAIPDENALPVATEDLGAVPPTLTVHYNAGATAQQIIDAIDATTAFDAEKDLSGDPTNDGSGIVSSSSLDSGSPYTLGDGDGSGNGDGYWPGFLDAWIDFNGNGLFEEAAERIFTAEPLRHTAVNSIDYFVPQDAVPGPTYARFRVTTDGNVPGPDGLALSGEVEDYLIDVTPMDYGDAPASYSTLYADGGARHVIAGPRLGTLADHDYDGQPSSDALGDDDDTPNDGTGTAAIPDGSTYTTAGGTATDPATIPDFVLPGLNNDFQILSPVALGAINGVNVVFQYVANPGDPASAVWDGTDTLTVTFEPGVTSVNDLLALINAEQVSGSPLEAGLIADADNDDEDGFDIASVTLVPGEWASVDVMVTDLVAGEPAYLKGWIDYRGLRDGTEGWETGDAIQWGDGSVVYADGYVDVSLITPNPDGTRTVHFLMPEDAEPGKTYLRFRLSSDATLSFDGLARDGEVEDYVGYIQMVDHGDAPLAGTAPHKFTRSPSVLGDPLVVNGPWLGATKPDHDLPIPVGGFNDDNTGTTPDDEDEGQILFSNSFGLAGLIPGEQATVQFTVSNAVGVVYGWIDFNNDGDFDDAGEQIVSGVTVDPAIAGTVQHTFDVPLVDVAPETVAARFRVVEPGDAWVPGPTGVAYSGEVEDFTVTVLPVDYGDAPNSGDPLTYPSFPTQRTDDGARHVIDVTGPWLGAVAPDHDRDGQPTPLAIGDGSDEDGLNFLGALLIPNETATLNVTVTSGSVIDAANPVYLNAWIDYNGDGIWDAAEHIFGGTAWTIVAAGVTTVTFDVPDEAIPGATYARFRISSEKDVSFVGLATDGEVEDYFGYIQKIDYGDAPLADGTNPARHVFTTTPATMGAPLDMDGPWLGSIAPDHDLPFPDDWKSDDDTLLGIDDEDEGDITFANALGIAGLIPGEMASVDVQVNNADGLVYAWIDFNGDGDFDDSFTETWSGVEYTWSEFVVTG
ncbi:MAG: S8 family serine peptidase, partial [Planctomycetaceae bacterium]|nr:S8 family serine peptidase [Planctomycetaceae bacterium]